MSEQVSYLDNPVGVFGDPVAENPTVVMHEAAFADLGIRRRYLTLNVKAEDLSAAIGGMRAMQFQGINLTIPHKVAVLQYLDQLAEDAEIMGAVNTVRRDGDKLIGENTDGKGFMRALREDAGVDPAGKRIVLLGAGGAARAVGVELARAGGDRITVVNRSEERGRGLQQLLSDRTGVQCSFERWTESFVLPAETDIVVQATSIGLFPDTDQAPDLDYESLDRNMLVCDVIPNPPNTRFLQHARERGCTTLDGLGMLVYQGAVAFTMWTGREAPVEVMKAALAEAFGP